MPGLFQMLSENIRTIRKRKAQSLFAKIIKKGKPMGKDTKILRFVGKLKINSLK
jgi:hypothetical protein